MGDIGMTFARTVLEQAVNLQAADDRIKQEVLDAALAGNSARVVEIVQRWITMPAIEVLGKGDCSQHITTPPVKVVAGAGGVGDAKP